MPMPNYLTTVQQVDNSRKPDLRERRSGSIHPHKGAHTVPAFSPKGSGTSNKAGFLTSGSTHSRGTAFPSHYATVTAHMLPGYSGGTAQDLHLISYYPQEGAPCWFSFSCRTYYTLRELGSQASDLSGSRYPAFRRAVSPWPQRKQLESHRVQG